MTTVLEKLIADEMSEWGISGVSMALVDDQQVIHAAGFGEARQESIFRVGSVSKLFNAVAVMQQVEAGKLNLDAPLPADVLPINPFLDSPPVTLRQTLCHRSGLQRESPVGGYFDDTRPGIAATVASVQPCVLATRPGAKTRYSNIAPTIAGHLVERASGLSFEDYQQKHLLAPFGMANSAWTLARSRRGLVLPSRMRVADGKGGWFNRAAPLFDLGTIPAGNLFSTVDDLAKFASALLRGGGEILKPETMDEMWRVQYAGENPPFFGLGFIVGKWRDRRLISHNGAVYGCSSLLYILPEEKVAVVVLANEDIVNGRTRNIAEAALAHLLEEKFGTKSPSVEKFSTPSNLSELAGDYESQSFWARLEVCDGTLTGEISGQRAVFTPVGGLNFAVNSRLETATPAAFQPSDEFTMGLQKFRRVPKKCPPLPSEWRRFCGGYGLDFIPVVISERHGHLYAMTENMVDYRLTPVNRYACALPLGMYTDEHIVFLIDADGAPRAMDFASFTLPRRS